MAYAAGIDVGSTQTKAVIVNEDGEIVNRALVDTGTSMLHAAERAYDKAMDGSGIREDELEYVIGTGYGRHRVTIGNAQITEIGCHARGAVKMFPGTRTVVDIGGHDTKAIRVAPGGEIIDFCMNDKCAAGTGRFLGSTAAALEIPLDELGPMSIHHRKPVRISTRCTVFAESDVYSWLGKGEAIQDILWGVHQSIATRVAALLRRVGITGEVTFTGGVANNTGMVLAMEETLHRRMNVSEVSQYMGALGAALFGLDRIFAGRRARRTLGTT